MPAWISDPPQPPQYDASSTGTYGTLSGVMGIIIAFMPGCGKSDHFRMRGDDGSQRVLAMINIAHSSNPVSDCFVVSSCSMKFPACKKLNSDIQMLWLSSFLSVYLRPCMAMFALLLCLHEVNEVRPINQVEGILRRNFGFLFKPFGKGCFIIFIAFLNFGLTVNTNLGMATGICLSIVGAGYILLYLRNPEVFEQGSPFSAKQPPHAYNAAPNSGPGV